MDDSTAVEWLSTAIGQATRSAKFCVVGCLPVVDPGIEVEGLGAVKLPLKRTTAKELVASCQSRRTERERRRWSTRRCETRLNSIRRSFA